jgi:tyrosyl-tRNA synthetase
MGQASAGGEAVRNIKMRLAEEIVKIYHSEKAAEKAKLNFINTFSKKETPSNLEEYTHPQKTDTLLNIISSSGLASSRSDARRLINDGAVEIDNEVKKDGNEKISIGSGLVLRVGKHRFVKIIAV